MMLTKNSVRLSQVLGLAQAWHQKNKTNKQKSTHSLVGREGAEEDDPPVSKFSSLSEKGRKGKKRERKGEGKRWRIGGS